MFPRYAALLLLFPVLLGAQSESFTAEVLSSEQIAPGVRQVRFRFLDDYTFTAGQFAFLTLPEDFIADWNGVWRTGHDQIRRPYSFATSPTDLPEFEILVAWAAPPRDQVVPPGIASTYLHAHLRSGDRLEWSAPHGTLTQSHAPRRPLVMVAGGTGLAPFLSLIRHWRATNPPTEAPLWLFFGARDRRQLLFHEELAAWAAASPSHRYIPALSSPGPTDNWSGATGFINVTMGPYVDELNDSEAYLAGPPIMVRESQKVLEGAGLARSRIHHD